VDHDSIMSESICIKFFNNQNAMLHFSANSVTVSYNGYKHVRCANNETAVFIF